MNKNYFCHESSYIDEPSVIGEGTKIWHFSHILKGCEIGKRCNIGQNVVIGPDVKLGNNVKVQNNVSVYKGVECEDDVFLGPSCVFTNVINPRSAVIRKDEYKVTLVEKGASIGANATIVCGVKLGKYCLVGAGSVVIKDVAPYAMVVGNPAIQKGWYSEQGHRLNFNDKGIAKCPSGENYEMKNGGVEKI